MRELQALVAPKTLQGVLVRGHAGYGKWEKPAFGWELEPFITGLVINDSGEVPRGEKMLYSGTVPESYITEYT